LIDFTENIYTKKQQHGFTSRVFTVKVTTFFHEVNNIHRQDFFLTLKMMLQEAQTAPSVACSTLLEGFDV
jgi:hypothetical protein